MGADRRVFLDVTLPCLDVVWQVARQAAGPGQDPEDLVQETYLRAWAGFGSYRGGNARAWLAAICLNVARSQARRRRRRPWEVSSPALPDLLPWSGADGESTADVADVVIAGLDAEEVSRCLALLPEPQRECIVLVDVAGYTAPEALPQRPYVGAGGGADSGCRARSAGGAAATGLTAAPGTSAVERVWPGLPPRRTGTAGPHRTRFLGGRAINAAAAASISSVLGAVSDGVLTSTGT